MLIDKTHYRNQGESGGTPLDEMVPIWYPEVGGDAGKMARRALVEDDMGKRLRVQVTVSYPMIVAMGLLADRNGVPLAQQATMSLRQALERTMESAECKRRVAEHNANRTAAEWRAEVSEEHLIERGMAVVRKVMEGKFDEFNEAQATGGPAEATAAVGAGTDAGQIYAVANEGTPHQSGRGAR